MINCLRHGIFGVYSVYLLFKKIISADQIRTQDQIHINDKFVHFLCLFEFSGSSRLGVKTAKKISKPKPSPAKSIKAKKTKISGATQKKPTAKKAVKKTVKLIVQGLFIPFIHFLIIFTHAIFYIIIFEHCFCSFFNLITRFRCSCSESKGLC